MCCVHSSDCVDECTSGMVRLSNGTSNKEGRVERCIDGMWTTICDNSWDDNDASVVCNQLGFSASGKQFT